ncbi:PKD domain-containing protein [Actinospica durhamensis]|uniref:PKD domain-containing protein n=1 Tax=Actinospica durhamensis TaxID=1508375 RepID=A0A941ITH9_9ACTN|nr:right-handed parallel beta-helix repeat-containing protein [Actinospica durhamensis]MBR7834371.1 PKD domain-containing protein [Actinospica durhamensis]
MTPLAAHADSSTPATYYVNDKSSACSDTGPGTQAVPFCSIVQAASVATVPGDTVLIAPGSYNGEVYISASGTATAPITFEAQNPSVSSWLTYVAAPTVDTNGYRLDVTGASYVDIVGLRFGAYSVGGQVLIDNSSHITLDHDVAYSTDDEGRPAYTISGTSSDVTLSRDGANAMTASTPAILVDASGTGNIVTTNDVSGHGPSAGIEVLGSAGVDVTSNTVTNYCGSGISVGDDANGIASGATIENNVVMTVGSNSTEPQCSNANTVGISLQSAADAVDATESHNTIYPNSNSAPGIYSWAGTPYSTPAAFTAATGQGAGDSIADPLTTTTGVPENESAPTINAANSDAPGELPTDILYQPRIDDPNVPETGGGSKPGYDRGAFQFTEALTQGTSTNQGTVPAGATATLTAQPVTSNWANATYTYTYDFGDGTPNETTADPTYPHAFANPGTYAVSITDTSDYGATYTGHFSIQVLAPVVVSAQMSQAPVGALGVQAVPHLTTDWPITTDTIDFGDGSPVQNLLDGGSDQHTYGSPGTYTVTATLGDSGGDTKTVTQTFTTAGNDFTPFGPKRLLDTRSGLGGTSSQFVDDGSVKLKVAGVDGIPADVTAVDLNLTEVGATGNGYIRASAGGNTGTSTLNYVGGAIYSNGVIVPVAADGTVTLSNASTRTSTTVNLIGDVSGYFAPVSSGSEYVSTGVGLRVMDTRSGLGVGKGRLAAGKTDVLTIAGAPHTPIPATGVTAVTVNLTEVATTGAGYLTAFPDAPGATIPNASTVDWQGTTTHAAGAIVPVGADGKIDIHNGSADGGSADVLVDITGYFTNKAGDSVYVPVTPQRVLDTRQLGSVGGGHVGQNSDKYLNMAGLDGTPSPSTASVSYVFNTTVTNTQASGYLSAGANWSDLTGTSMLNWTGANQTIANLSFVGTNPDSTAMDVYFYYGGSSPQPKEVDVLADVMGYFSSQ